jgi:phosphoglycerate dehydrogenase-like enzyme
MLPPKDQLSICFAHVAYRLQERFQALGTGIKSYEVRDPETLLNRMGEADVLVISGLWRDALLERAPRLRLVQSIGAGTDQFPRDELVRRGIRLASARGVNARAVAEHAMALVLALSRRLPEARDNQAQRVWRGMIGDLATREDEIGGKTLLVVGLATSAAGSRGSPRRSTCASSGCAAIRRRAAARPMRCTGWVSSTRCCPRQILSC